MIPVDLLFSLQGAELLDGGLAAILIMTLFTSTVVLYKCISLMIARGKCVFQFFLWLPEYVAYPIWAEDFHLGCKFSCFGHLML